jgi:hypothetical protein
MKLKVKEVLYPKILPWLPLLAHILRGMVLFVKTNAGILKGVIGTGNYMKRI